jgi:two-component system invasion response regulator UvrY
VVQSNPLIPPDRGSVKSAGVTSGLRVLICDNHAIARKGLTEILKLEFEGVICGEARNSRELFSQVLHERWDLVILNGSMPGRIVLDALTKVKRVRPKLPIVVISMHSQDQYGKRALKAGAAGYMNEESTPGELTKAIQTALAGGIYVSPTLAWPVRGDALDSIQKTLSSREFEVLRMIALGETLTGIAKQLHLSVNTVSTYRTRILEKLNLENTTELIRYAFVNRLID